VRKLSAKVFFFFKVNYSLKHRGRALKSTSLCNLIWFCKKNVFERSLLCSPRLQFSSTTSTRLSHPFNA